MRIRGRKYIYILFDKIHDIRPSIWLKDGRQSSICTIFLFRRFALYKTMFELSYTDTSAFKSLFICFELNYGWRRRWSARRPTTIEISKICVSSFTVRGARCCSQCRFFFWTLNKMNHICFDPPCISWYILCIPCIHNILLYSYGLFFDYTV